MAALRVAGVGAGYFSQFHVEGWTTLPDVDYVALCDTDEAKAQALAKRFGVARVYSDVARMLDEIQPDLVDIVTPPATHRTLVQLACERRVATICQKALAPTYDEAVAIVDDAQQARIPFVVHENFRFQPWYREAKRLLENGTLGTPHSIAFRLRPGDGQGPRAYLDRQPYFQQMERFLVYETAIHFIDTYRYLLGEVRSVWAQLRRINPAIAGEDAGYIVFTFDGGATGLFDGNRLNDHVSDNPRRTMGEMWLEGSAGVLRLDGAARLWFKPHQRDEHEHRYDRGPDDTFGGGCVRALQAHVVDHLRNGAPLENGGRDYLANLRVQEAVYRSSAQGRRVELD
ncbi:MAG TPA: Gfo/Idh/MocA family oxidoreductase [Burkholderiaceae bacterium]|jgi:D-apiose dehydrogenase|nr:Gfo/Idh/MocA family oxidoreductase [Burkholderiaceae bacterium]